MTADEVRAAVGECPPDCPEDSIKTMAMSKQGTIRISTNLELAFNADHTEVSINRTDNTSCFIDIEVRDGKLELVYCDNDQRDTQ
jgi:hypothetical protein